MRCLESTQMLEVPGSLSHGSIMANFYFQVPIYLRLPIVEGAMRAIPEYPGIQYLRPYQSEAMLRVHQGLHHKLRDHLVVRIPLKTGIRSGELRMLTFEDIDWKRKRLYILDSKKKVMVPVPVDQETLELLREYGAGRKGPLFPSQKGGSLTKWGLRYTVKRVAKAAGLQFWRSMRFYVLRHTFAINWLRNGGNIEVLRRILRHTSLRTTQIYLNFENEMVDREYRRVMG